MDGDAGIKFAHATNNRLGEAVRQHPDRFGGFTHLPMRIPEAAVDELEHCVRDLGFRGAMVNRLNDGRFLDDERFAPVLSKAVELDVPVYIRTCRRRRCMRVTIRACQAEPVHCLPLEYLAGIRRLQFMFYEWCWPEYLMSYPD